MKEIIEEMKDTNPKEYNILKGEYERRKIEREELIAKFELAAKERLRKLKMN